MEPARPETHVLVERARDADWDGVRIALDTLSQNPLARTSAALHDRARLLEEALTSARAARADLAASALRLGAAAQFGERQDFAGSPVFCRTLAG